jgi:IS605 OrfB family transposase
MLTLKLKISSISDSELLSEYISSYTGLFYKLYNNPELMNDKVFIQQNISDKIDKSIYDFCVIDVKTKLNQRETRIKSDKKEIEDIEKLLLKNNFKTEKELRKKYKLINKLSRLKRNINKNITFGGKSLLREITKLSQINHKTEKQIALLKSKKEEFKSKRKLGLYLVGRACEKGNRKVDFDLDNNKIIFKANKRDKIEINFKQPKDGKQKNILRKLQIFSKQRLIPLTVTINNEYINIAYDNEFLNGYSFNENECKKEQKRHICTENKKQIYIKYKKEQNDRKLFGKLENRYLSFDLNPKYIGFSIFDSNENNDIDKIIYKEYIDLNKLSLRLGLSSENHKQRKQNNKRKHEIKEVWKYIFNLARHYKVYNIVMEDLDFKSNNKDGGNKEFNRQTKNIWHKTLTESLIKKYCENGGLNLIKVNPCYSSFIGNMIYDYPDPIAASLEIGRRGIVKYIKGSSIYPKVFLINQEKLNYLLGENVDTKGFGWLQLYGLISLLRYRNPVETGLKGTNLYSYKSKVYRFIY